MFIGTKARTRETGLAATDMTYPVRAIITPDRLFRQASARREQYRAFALKKRKNQVLTVQAEDGDGAPAGAKNCCTSASARVRGMAGRLARKIFP